VAPAMHNVNSTVITVMWHTTMGSTRTGKWHYKVITINNGNKAGYKVQNYKASIIKVLGLG